MRNIEIYNFQKFPSDHVTDITDYRDAIASKKYWIQSIRKYCFEECNKGKPYNITLKMSGCAEDEFTCGDGQCIDIKYRCDQVIDCRDKTDELDCSLLVLQDGYNQAIPPFSMVKIHTKKRNI